MSTTTKNTQATKTVSQGESRYGTPEPQIALRFPKGTSYRVVKAALHKLAAEIELATPASERWCVNTGCSSSCWVTAPGQTGGKSGTCTSWRLADRPGSVISG
jgi:hypothetical protein